MSVQNGERLATKQDLADMYQGILPYLGGMPEMLANKFSKGDLYDTSEKMIGKWINGKPVYQKVITGLTLQFEWNSTKFTTVTVSPLISNVEKVLGIIGIKDDGTEFGDIAFYNDGNKWNLYSEHGLLVNTLAIKYTKSTDSANSFNIGESTDYSTDEKIIGTWLDGEPLYQRTFHLTNPKTDWTANSLDIVVDKVFLTNAYYESSGNWAAGCSYYTSSNNMCSILVYKGLIANNAEIWIQGSSALGSISNLYVTLQYTKFTS